MFKEADIWGNRVEPNHTAEHNEKFIKHHRSEEVL